MNGKELRSAMWQQVKDRRGYLLLGLIITLLPIMVQNMLVNLSGITIPVFLGSPFGIFSNLLTIGLCKIAMDQVAGSKKTLRDMFFFLKKGLLGKALMLSVVLWVVNTAFTVLPSLLQQNGNSLMAASLANAMVTDQGTFVQGELFYGLGGLLNLACGFISMVILFPIQYRFVLHPEEPLMDQLAEGVALGWKNFRGVFGYRFMLSLPMGVLFMAYYGCTIFLTQYALFVVVAFVAAFCFYQPFVILAEAALAKRLFVMEEKGKMTMNGIKRESSP